jgi:hypothetical protein
MLRLKIVRGREAWTLWCLTKDTYDGETGGARDRSPSSLTGKHMQGKSDDATLLPKRTQQGHGEPRTTGEERWCYEKDVWSAHATASFGKILDAGVLQGGCKQPRPSQDDIARHTRTPFREPGAKNTTSSFVGRCCMLARTAIMENVTEVAPSFGDITLGIFKTQSLSNTLTYR